jgi:hypothetical protein
MLTLLLLLSAAGGCSLDPEGEGLGAGGIVIYNDDGLIMNVYGEDHPFEIVFNSTMQLYAVVLLSGNSVEWTTSDPGAMTVNASGEIHSDSAMDSTSTSVKRVIITATSKQNPEISARVFFDVRGSRPRS